LNNGPSWMTRHILKKAVALIFGRIISALQDRFPNVSTFAAWGLRRIQRDCLFKDVAGHP